MAGLASLAERLARLIRATGPIPLAAFMAEANAVYYARADPLGAAGDFTTAPEISQMFGEMIGVWLADLWRRAGSPPRVIYAELGPGRGTLARDALSVLRRFGLTARVHFVETSPVLRAAQSALVPDATWHDDIATLPDDGPLLLVANEFFDALPVRQLVTTPAGWRERMVGLTDAGGFVALVGDRPMDAAVPAPWRPAPPGAILESCPAAVAVAREIGRRLGGQGGAALIIDYGYAAPRLGSSLQAVRLHARADPFADPGEADLTAHVDFAALAAAAAAGAGASAVVDQGAWLTAMGIAERAAALKAAHPEQAGAIAAAHARLTAAGAMGTLFKVMALTARDWPVGAVPDA